MKKDSKEQVLAMLPGTVIAAILFGMTFKSSHSIADTDTLIGFIVFVVAFLVPGLPYVIWVMHKENKEERDEDHGVQWVTRFTACFVSAAFSNLAGIILFFIVAVIGDAIP